MYKHIHVPRGAALIIILRGPGGHEQRRMLVTGRNAAGSYRHLDHVPAKYIDIEVLEPTQILVGNDIQSGSAMQALSCELFGPPAGIRVSDFSFFHCVHPLF